MAEDDYYRRDFAGTDAERAARANQNVRQINVQRRNEKAFNPEGVLPRTGVDPGIRTERLPSDVRLISSTSPAGTMAGVEGMDPRFADALNRLIAASGGRIYIQSGFRSVDRQSQLFAAAVKKYGSESAARKWVAPPGKSNHNRGWAADLGGDLSLAHKLAPQFGLVFPMSWERWHIEPAWARSKAPRDAYTTTPAGEVNPTDPAYESNPDYTLASFTDSMRRALHGDIPDEQGTQFMPQGDVQDGTITGDVGSFLGAIRQHESGGNYKAKNPHGSASGAYQFIDSTWRAYASRLGIGAARAMDASPADQDRVAAAYLQSLQGISSDPRLWAVGWYGGPGEMQKLLGGSRSWDYAPAGNNGLTYRSYADWIVSHMGSTSSTANSRPASVV